ncbi:uncharacterized protein KY384_004209 [Bacidia gigantensis]|uniref:uncharacterized protein n=1 Tax=Bacidia gigantensis TaxID=2732470 RepID=UPI001D047FEA|nr:uncharacterized protein KY384_004209 [Bacidia gigantensis]KAG8530852.1 hypothetical protein KY384_004209 [Bacidia gigantensis]
MRTLQTLSILGISPVLQCTACRHAPLFSHQDLRPQCPSTLPSSPNPTLFRRSLTQARLSSSSSPTFSYRIAASFSGKGRRFNPKTDLYSHNSDLELLEGAFTGRPSSGQDAFFVSKIGNSSSTAFGVADGVGGWSDSGFDSAHFSHGLCQWMARGAEMVGVAGGEAEVKKLGPRELLEKAYAGIVADKVVEGGGSTACVAVGRGDGNLTVANLGDSGFVQLRLNAVNYYSNPQTHAFNTPYQLSIVPPRVLALSKAFGGGPLHDLPKDAGISTHEVRHGDVLVFATDGVWDNLNPTDLLKIVSRQMTGFQAWVNGDKGTEVSDKIYDLAKDGGIAVQVENSLQSTLAVNIVGEAKAASVDHKRDGPFAKEVQRFYPHEDWHGGKVDDICVVVAVVIHDEPAPP